jgi:hypothetical protein
MKPHGFLQLAIIILLGISFILSFLALQRVSFESALLGAQVQKYEKLLDIHVLESCDWICTERSLIFLAFEDPGQTLIIKNPTESVQNITYTVSTRGIFFEPITRTILLQPHQEWQHTYLFELPSEEEVQASVHITVENESGVIASHTTNLTIASTDVSFASLSWWEKVLYKHWFEQKLEQVSKATS